MAIVIKALDARIVTASGLTVLYTVPTAKSAVIDNVRLVNNDGAAQTPTMRLEIKPSGGGTARLIHKKDFTIAASGSFVMPDQVTLGQGDLLQLTLNSAATGVAVMVNGVERD